MRLGGFTIVFKSIFHNGGSRCTFHLRANVQRLDNHECLGTASTENRMSIHSWCYAEQPDSQGRSSQGIESYERVRQWLDDTPDFRANNEMSTSKNWATASYLEEWEEESLFEALSPIHPFLRCCCCFRGIFQKFTRAKTKGTRNSCDEKNSEGWESLLDISQEHDQCSRNMI